MSPKNRDLFSSKHLFLIVASKECSFQDHIEMELKNVFVIFEGFFEWQKIKLGNSNF